MVSALGTEQVAAEILIRRKLKGAAVIPGTEGHKLWKPRQLSPLQEIAGEGNKTGHTLPITVAVSCKHGICGWSSDQISVWLSSPLTLTGLVAQLRHLSR